MTSVEQEIEAVFAAAGAQGFLYARELGGGPEVCVRADEGVVLASVFKIVVAVAYARAVAAGELDPVARTTITERYRIGGVGTAGCADDVEMSWRDVALNMLVMSDNAATDVLYRRLGQDAIDRVLADLGLARTRLVGCCEDLFSSVAADLGVSAGGDVDALLAATGEERLRGLGVLDPERTTSSTPREIGRLLEAIWADTAATPQACRAVRDIMARQIWPHRLSSGFPDGVAVAAKTGTLPSIRNECGVVTYPDGRQYAVAVFTRSHDLAERQPRVDAAIGAAGRIAVEHLRATDRPHVTPHHTASVGGMR